MPDKLAVKINNDSQWETSWFFDGDCYFHHILDYKPIINFTFPPHHVDQNISCNCRITIIFQTSTRYQNKPFFRITSQSLGETSYPDFFFFNQKIKKYLLYPLFLKTKLPHLFAHLLRILEERDDGMFNFFEDQKYNDTFPIFHQIHLRTEYYM